MRNSRNGKYEKYKKLIKDYIIKEYEKYIKNPRDQQYRSFKKYGLPNAQKQNKQIIFYKSHRDIYNSCNIPRSSYYDVLPNMMNKKLILRIPIWYYDGDSDVKDYTMVAITKKHLKI